MDLRGRGGQSTSTSTGATDRRSYLGVATAGFPNMFMILGPNGPFTNLPPTIEAQVEWIADAIAAERSAGAGLVESTPRRRRLDRDVRTRSPT